MKFTLHLKPVNGGQFNNMPARDVELEDSEILANDVIFTNEFNPNNVRLWVIGHEFGAICAMWSSEHELLDTAVDAGKMNGFSAEDEHKECDAVHTEACVNDCPHTCDHALLGNASEPFDLSNCWYQQVDIAPSENTFALLLRFAEARGSASDTLYF